MSHRDDDSPPPEHGQPDQQSQASRSQGQPSEQPPGQPPGQQSWRREYWRRNLRLMLVLLVIWFLVSFGCGILFVDQLNAITILGFPLGFWFAQQGSIYTFVLLILIYAVRMDRLDDQFGVSERDGEGRRL